MVSLSEKYKCHIPYKTDLVIGVSSSALFNLKVEDEIFRKEGLARYRDYQLEKQEEKLDKGVAFPFIRRFLKLNETYSSQRPVEVVLLSQNDPDSGLRMFNSIEEYGLDISRAAFTNGRDPYSYIKPFNISLFLSANKEHVEAAIEQGYAAGLVLEGLVQDDDSDTELRVAFDFDGVIADDASEKIYAQKESLLEFQEHETKNVNIPHTPGPLQELFKKLSFFQAFEEKKHIEDPNYKRKIRISIVTARNAPSHKRLITTLRDWKIVPDEAFFLGGINKKEVLEVLKPHIYFDDQLTHLELSNTSIPAVHIPFGIRNQG